MTRSLTLAALLLGLSVPAARAEMARYDLDPDHVVVAFLVKHIGYENVLGTFAGALLLLSAQTPAQADPVALAAEVAQAPAPPMPSTNEASTPVVAASDTADDSHASDPAIDRFR